jgi:hypothetical protein
MQTTPRNGDFIHRLQIAMILKLSESPGSSQKENGGTMAAVSMLEVRARF